MQPYDSARGTHESETSGRTEYRPPAIEVVETVDGVVSTAPGTTFPTS